MSTLAEIDQLLDKLMLLVNAVRERDLPHKGEVYRHLYAIQGYVHLAPEYKR